MSTQARELKLPQDGEVAAKLLQDKEEAETSKFFSSRDKKVYWRIIVCLVVLVTTLAVFAIHWVFASWGDNAQPKIRAHGGPEAAWLPIDALKSVVGFRLAPCGGQCQNGYTCVTAGTYSQCIDCSPTGNWPYDCVTYDPAFKQAAIASCGLACENFNVADYTPDDATSKTETIESNVATSADMSCALGPVVPDYKEDRCSLQDDGSLKVMCERPDSKYCGMRFSSYRRTGSGKYLVAMQPARGPGVSTRFYLYSFDRNESRSKPWNSIAFEVLGSKCGKTESRIWTIFNAGDFNLAKSIFTRESEHHKFITVPFDACADWHTYEIYVDDVKIIWKVDGYIYRKENISGHEFDDLRNTMSRYDFQAHLKLFGQDNSPGPAYWAQMGNFEDSMEEFPIYAWFGNLVLPGLHGR